MDIIKLLPEYLDTGVDAAELTAIAQAALAQRIRNVKLSIAEAVVQARACTLLDNLEGSHQALQRARQLQKEYHHFLVEWQRLSQATPPGRTTLNSLTSVAAGEPTTSRNDPQAA